VAQETILRAWRHRATCASADRPEPWLRAIARREALRAVRAAPSPEPPEAAVRAEPDHADAATTRIDVARALKRLSARERDVVLRHYWQDMSCEEIAGALACPVGTVKARLHRARHKLGAALAPPDKLEA
jgi:RNA polymerase sigma factor (sigma-70 family)